MDSSRQTLGEDAAGATMYLSFDSESTMSSVAYKTMADFSCNEPGDMDTVEDSKESHGNSTLEPQEENGLFLRETETLKIFNKMGYSPLRPLKQNLLPGYSAMSSTPTKEQLKRSVETLRGSEAERCMDVGLAFRGMEKEKVSIPVIEENKENSVLGSSEATLLTHTEVASSVIEKTSTASSSKENFGVEAEQKERITKFEGEVSPNILHEISRNLDSIKPKVAKVEEKIVGIRKSLIRAIPTRSQIQPGRIKVSAVSAADNLVKNNVTALKPQQKLISEPNLVTNKPSRILTRDSKRVSFLPSKVAPSATQEGTELSKMLKNKLKLSTAGGGAISATSTVISAARKPIGTATKGRTSMLPTATGEKRPYGFSGRMSVVVKTTLNSPARKIPRKSLAPIAFKSTYSSNGAEASSSGMGAPRKSIMPVRKTVSSTSANAMKFPSQFLGIKSDVDRPNGTSGQTIGNKKLEANYTCSTCQAQFRIKSLLDAHKRSHEDSIASFCRKSPNPKEKAKEPIGTSSNQCKFCDRKFALVRALHIHLLQNCSKIPPSEKRKLQFTEMQHVEKAQLPSCFHMSSGRTVNTTAEKMSNNSSSSTPFQRSRSNSSASLQSTMITKNDILKIIETSEMALEMGPPASKSTAGHRNAPFSGIHRTPNKSVKCHMCNKNFQCALDYTNHIMMAHSSA